MFERVSRHVLKSKDSFHFSEVQSVLFGITVKNVSRDIPMDQRIKGIKNNRICSIQIAAKWKLNHKMRLQEEKNVKKKK